MPSTSGLVETFVIENDFRDAYRHNKSAKEDIYQVNKNYIKTMFGDSAPCINLKISKKNQYDLRDNELLKTYTREILETLNLIDQCLNNAKVRIVIDKADISSYETLFQFIGTYPNIDIDFKEEGNIVLSIYDVLDLYKAIKNSNIRDFVCFTVRTKTSCFTVKTKKYSNLKEILDSLEIKYTKIKINETILLQIPNFLVDDNIYEISIV